MTRRGGCSALRLGLPPLAARRPDAAGQGWPLQPSPLDASRQAAARAVARLAAARRADGFPQPVHVLPTERRDGSNSPSLRQPVRPRSGRPAKVSLDPTALAPSPGCLSRLGRGVQGFVVRRAKRRGVKRSRSCDACCARRDRTSDRRLAIAMLLGVVAGAAPTALLQAPGSADDAAVIDYRHVVQRRHDPVDDRSGARCGSSAGDLPLASDRQSRRLRPELPHRLERSDA